MRSEEGAPAAAVPVAPPVGGRRERRRRDGGDLEAKWERRRTRSGDLWERIGRLQFDFLVDHGLQPSHYLLDVGCGSLRGGVHFIRFLEPGHYYGVDKNPESLAAARTVELPRNGLTDKAPVLVEMDDFGFERLGRRFDVAIAQSVFTHLPLNDIIRCLMNVERVLEPGGRFFATFFENPAGKRNLLPIPHPVGEEDPWARRGLFSYFDRDPYHYDVDTFRWICAGTRLRVEHLGAWNHPRDQRMLLFTRQPDDGGTA